MYDKFGLEYVLHGGPPPTPGGGAGGGASPFEGGMPGGFGGFGGMPGGGTRTFHFTSTPGGGGARGFRFSSADDIFRNAFAGGGGDDDDIFNILSSGGFGGGGFSGFGGGPGAGGGIPRTTRTAHPGMGGMGAGGGARRPPTQEATVVEKELPLTLEEIFNGTKKNVTTKSKSFDASGKKVVRDLTLEAVIKPGLRSGSKIKYRDIGDNEEGGKQDLHLIVKEVS